MTRTLMCFAAAAALLAGAPALAGPTASDVPAAPAGDTTAADPASPDTAAAPATAATPAPTAAASAHAGLAVKDNTGATIGQITEVKPGADGKQTAVIKMGEQTFAVATTSLGITAEAATINMTAAEIAAMVKAKS